jgi:hypothetical protein
VLHNKTAQPLPVRANLSFPAAEEERILTLDRHAADFTGVARVWRVPAGAERFAETIELAPGEGAALTLRPARPPLFRLQRSQ